MEKLGPWEKDELFTPKGPEDRMKHTMQMCELVKADQESGEHTSWGISPGGGHGYALTDKDEKEVSFWSSNLITGIFPEFVLYWTSLAVTSWISLNLLV